MPKWKDDPVADANADFEKQFAECTKGMMRNLANDTRSVPPTINATQQEATVTRKQRMLQERLLFAPLDASTGITWRDETPEPYIRSCKDDQDINFLIDANDNDSTGQTSTTPEASDTTVYR